MSADTVDDPGSWGGTAGPPWSAPGFGGGAPAGGGIAAEEAAGGPQAAPPPAWGAPPSPPRRSWPRPWLIALILGVLVGALAGGVVGAEVATSSQQTIVERFRPAPSDLGIPGAPTDVAAIIQRVLPAVVSIQSTAFVPSAVGLGQTIVGAGTGMIVTSSGEVLTNNHVVAGAISVRVTLYGQTKTYPGKVIGTDPARDMALVKIEGVHGLPTVSFAAPSAIALGEGVVAIGNALALAPGSPSVTSGIVSGLDRSFSAQLPDGYTEHITGAVQIDAAINPGNSGGPLVDAAGQVIGMDTAVAASAPNNAPAQNVGFAIPVNQIRSELAALERGAGAPSAQTYLGVVVATVTPALQAELGVAPSSGAVVLQVVPGSPAAGAGIQRGDVVVAIDGKPVDAASALAAEVRSHRPGQTIDLTIVSGTTERQVAVRLGSEYTGVP